MIITTSETINGKFPKKTLGIVRGSTVRARWIGRDFAASLKSVFGGEIKSYTSMVESAREEALERMKIEAKEIGANAIIMTRFTTSNVMQGASEILVFGTAVII